MSYNPMGFGFGKLPEVTKNFLIINVLLFVAMITAEASYNVDLGNILGMHLWGSEAFQPYQIVTHMFMHGSLGHIFFNMFALWMFGAVLERVWGAKRFFIFYLVCGLGAALIYMITAKWGVSKELSMMTAFLDSPSLESLNTLIENHRFWVDSEFRTEYKQFQSDYAALVSNPGNSEAMNGVVNYIGLYKDHYLNLPVVVGASGAVYGLLLAFGMLFPNQKLYLYFAIPVKAKYVVIGLGALALWMGIQNNPGDNIAHFAHLGGMIFGFLLLKYPGFYKM